VQARDGNLYAGSTRITVETIIRSWQSGRTPEEIATSFPSVPLATVYGAIAYYLEHKDEMDAFFQETEELDNARQASDEAADPEFYARMRQRVAEARVQLNLESPVP
jgi:uncharacterized protein (DUF433 family)